MARHSKYNRHARLSARPFRATAIFFDEDDALEAQVDLRIKFDLESEVDGQNLHYYEPESLSIRDQVEEYLADATGRSVHKAMDIRGLVENEEFRPSNPLATPAPDDAAWQVGRLGN